MTLMAYKDPEVQRAYQREWMKRRRDEWIAQNGPCAQCGSQDRLQVDHLDPALKLSHRVWSWAKEKREAELAKCQVLCCSCHHAKTVQQNPGYRAGTKNPRAKLTEEQVRQIRTMSGSSAEIAPMFGVHSSIIRKIRHGGLWNSI